MVGILSDDTDPMVSVMRVEKAPLESYADIGGLESQIQVRSSVFQHLSHHGSLLLLELRISQRGAAGHELMSLTPVLLHS